MGRRARPDDRSPMNFVRVTNLALCSLRCISATRRFYAATGRHRRPQPPSPLGPRGGHGQQTSPRRLAPGEQMLWRNIVPARDIRYHRAGGIGFRHYASLRLGAPPTPTPRADLDLDPAARARGVNHMVDHICDSTSQRGRILPFIRRASRVGTDDRLLCIAAYGFLISERETIPPSGLGPARPFSPPALSNGYQPRGSAAACRTARPKFHRNDASTADRRHRRQVAAMPMLRSSNGRAAAEKSMTQ